MPSNARGGQQQYTGEMDGYPLDDPGNVFNGAGAGVPPAVACISKCAIQPKGVSLQAVVPAGVPNYHHNCDSAVQWIELRYLDGQAPALVCPCSLTLWTNWLAIGIAVLETVQLVSMGLNCAPNLADALIEYLPAGVVHAIRTSSEIFFSFGGDVSDEDPTRWTFLATSIFSALYVLLSGIFIALDLGTDSFIAPILFSLLAGGLFVTVTSALLFVIINTSRTYEAIISAVCLVYYSSTAVFMSIYRGDASAKNASRAAQIASIPLFLAVERVLKGILSATFVLVPNAIWRSIAVIGVITMYEIVLTLWRPMSVPAMSASRTVGVFCGWWAAFVAVVASQEIIAANALGICLLAGWTAALIFLVGWLYLSCGHPCSCCTCDQPESRMKQISRARARSQTTRQ